MNKQLFLTILYAIFTANLLAYTMFNGNSNSFLLDVLFSLAPIVAVIVGFLLAREYGTHTVHGKSFLLITIGICFMAFSDFAWGTMKQFLDMKTFPSLVDVLHLTGYPFLIYGIVIWLRTIPCKPGVYNLVIASLISLALLVIAVYSGIYGVVSAEKSFWENLFGSLYGVANMVVAVLLAIVFLRTISFGKGRFFYPTFFFFVGFVIHMNNDILYATLHEAYSTGGEIYALLDIFWVIAYLFVAYSFASQLYIIKDIQNRITKNKL